MEIKNVLVKRLLNFMLYILTVTVLITIVTGCTAYRHKKILKIEVELIRAGFQLKSANTPEKLAHIKAMPKDKLILHKYKNKLYYIFADPATEGIYIGTKENYNTFKENLRENEINNRRESTFSQNMEEMLWQGDCGYWCNLDIWYGDWYY